MFKDLLPILACPQNHMALRTADAALLARLNRAIRGGHVKNSAGQSIQTPLAGALVRQDGAVAYPIVDDIPVLLVEESIALDQIGENP